MLDRRHSAQRGKAITLTFRRTTTIRRGTGGVSSPQCTDSDVLHEGITSPTSARSTSVSNPP